MSIEAENFDENTPRGGHTFEFQTDRAGFSGTGFMRVEPDSGTNNNANYTTNSPRLDYLVDFVKTGTHYVWVRYIRTGGGDDSSHVGLDGDGTTSDRIRAPGPNNQWNWNNDRRDGQGIAQFEVASPGAHVVNVWMREDGWRFDKLVLTTAGNFTPADLGPPESGRGPQFTAGGASPDNGASDVPW